MDKIDVVEREFRAMLAKMTGGLAPQDYGTAFWDWWLNLARSPAKQMELQQTAMKQAMDLWRFSAEAAQGKPMAPTENGDRRFANPAWQQYPFNVYAQAFQNNIALLEQSARGVEGVEPKNAQLVEFAARQAAETLSPANNPMTNPEVLQQTIAERGQNLARGYKNFLDDMERTLSGGEAPGTEDFRVGEKVAVTEGQVIFRNDLIELIQYAPTTPDVHAEPVLIVPAWIMKYYILDLSPSNSLVKYLTGQGFIVFMISWKNPGPEDRDLGMEDYRMLGVMAALDVVSAVVPGSKVHAVGYCIGGTLLSIAAAAMARDGDGRLKSITLFAAQTDFEEAGELMLFIHESQVTFLEDMMWEQGFLDTKQMAGAFQLLRSNDLVWSRMVREYLMGERGTMIDLMAWNADATRMPYRMHSEYLRRLFLDNDLAEGRYRVADQPIALADIRAPIFCVATTRDHVAPWRSVHKIHLLINTGVTFLLTTGGHNAGIVSKPGGTGRSYQVLAKSKDDRYSDPDAWAAAAPCKDGSWWPEWVLWLQARSGAPVTPPAMGGARTGLAPLCDAPGAYVLQD